MLGYDKRFNDKHSVTLGKHQNPFSAGAPPQTPLGAQTHPRLPSRLWRKTPSPLPSARVPSALRTPVSHPPAVPSGSAPVCVKQKCFQSLFLNVQFISPIGRMTE